jgi:hypothetical protein
MKFSADLPNKSEKKPFVKPELKALNVKETQTGTRDPNEFAALIGPTS